MSLLDPAPAVHDQVNSQPHRENAPDQGSFKDRQTKYLADLLEQKWDCEIPGHTVCVPTVDGYHCQLSEEEIAAWVQALCLRKATMAQPPDYLLSCTINHPRSDLKHGSSKLRAVAIAPSRSLNIKLPALAASASLYQRLQNVTSSWPSSGVLGMGSYSGKAIKWLGEKGLNTVDNIILFKRTRKYLRWLEKWEEEISCSSLPIRHQIGKDKQNTLFKILEEALEMSRPCYSSRVNACAAAIGSKLVAWVNWTGTTPDAPLTEEMALWFSHVHSCLSPLHLAGVYRKDPLAGDVACELLDAITTVPVSHQDRDRTSAVIRTLARELAFSPYSPKHRRLGQDLARLIQLVVQFRPLTPDDMLAVRDMATRRLERNGDKDTVSSRPWEVVIFVLCGSQDPWLAQVVQGSRGLPGLLSTLKEVLMKPVIHKDEEWFHLCDILQILCALSSRRADIIALTPGIMDALLCAFRENIPRKWFLIQDRVIHIIRRIVSYRPALVQDLIRLNGAAAFGRFTSVTMPRGASRCRKRIRNVAVDEARGLLVEMKATLKS